MTAETQNLIPLFDCGTGSSWRERNQHLFRTEPALRWFQRRHLRELVDAGALLKHSDRWLAVEPNMTRAVIEIGQRAARRTLEMD